MKANFILNGVSLILILIFIIPVSMAIGAVTYTLYSDQKGEFIKLTSYGFAIFVGISSMVFSWSRALTAEHEYWAGKLNKSGANAVICAIGFLCCNLLRYLSIMPVDKIPFPILFKSMQIPIYIMLIAVEILTVSILWTVVPAWLNIYYRKR